MSGFANYIIVNICICNQEYNREERRGLYSSIVSETAVVRVNIKVNDIHNIHASATCA